MRLILELNLSYITCDTCGDGYNRMYVWLNEETERYTYERRSNCYGNRNEDDLTLGLLIRAMDEDKLLVATRYAKQQLAGFRRGLREHGFKSVSLGSAQAEPVEYYDQPCTDTCCNPVAGPGTVTPVPTIAPTVRWADFGGGWSVPVESFVRRATGGSLDEWLAADSDPVEDDLF